MSCYACNSLPGRYSIQMSKSSRQFLKSVSAVLKSVLGITAVIVLYIGIWSLIYHSPPSPPEAIDLRNSPAECAYSLKFCAGPADNPSGFPGHAYVVFTSPLSKEQSSFGFMPRKYFDQVVSLFADVPGMVVDNQEANQNNLELLSVIVDAKTYTKTLKLAKQWDSTKFRAGKRDCVSLVHYLASELGLRSTREFILFPQDYLRSLKKLN